MPANLPPQYFEVEKKYREAKQLPEKLVYLQELLSIIPKHKGTEKLQAELKTKISKLKEQLTQKRKSGSSTAWYQVEKQGAGQVVLLGLPNCGKSFLLNTLTNAHSEVGAYPFTTNLPDVGMMPIENIKIQIVDTPPIHQDAPAWLYAIYRGGDLLVILLDSQGDFAGDFETISNLLNTRNIFFEKTDYGDIKDVIIVLNKIDGQKDSSTSNIREFIQKYQNQFSVIPISATNGEGIEKLKREIFTQLKIIRIYTKKIGMPIIRNDPVILKKGATVIDAAEHIHKDFKKNMKYVRLWNDFGYNGQRVEKNHILQDGDVIEFHI